MQEGLEAGSRNLVGEGVELRIDDEKKMTMK